VAEVSLKKLNAGDTPTEAKVEIAQAAEPAKKKKGGLC
jgi:hypothetical protein